MDRLDDSPQCFDRKLAETAFASLWLCFADFRWQSEICREGCHKPMHNVALSRIPSVRIEGMESTNGAPDFEGPFSYPSGEPAAGYVLVSCEPCPMPLRTC